MGRPKKKYWRISKKQYDTKLNEFVVDRMGFIRKNIKEEFTDKNRIIKIKEEFEKFDKLYDINNLTDEAIEFALNNIIVQDVKDWSRFSLDTEAKVEDIIFRAILSKLRKQSYVCLSMESYNPKLTEDVWRDIAYIRSGLFNFDEWDDKHVNVVTSFISYNRGYKVKEDKKLLKLYTKDQIPDLLITNLSLPDHILDENYDNKDDLEKSNYEISGYISTQIRRLTVNF